jgi:hypothetical protein
MLLTVSVAQALRRVRIGAASALFHAAEIAHQVGLRLYLDNQTNPAGLRRIWVIACYLERLARFAAFGHSPTLHRRKVRNLRMR